MTPPPTVAEEYECWECWNIYVVVRRRGRALAQPASGLTIEIPCPYCGRQSEFDSSVVGVRALDIQTPERRLRSLRRRLRAAAADILVRVHDLQQAVSAHERALADARRQALSRALGRGRVPVAGTGR